MSNILMLWPDINEDIPQILEKYYSDIVHVENLYSPIGKIGRIFRRLLSKYNFSTKMFFGGWYKSVNEFEVVILHANMINRSVPRILRNNGFKGRIIYWYWNPVRNCISPYKVERRYCELWSFDKHDCNKYNMKYNSTYYFHRLPNVKLQPEYDLFFVGLDKGRYNRIMDLKKHAEDMGYKTNFYIIKDSTSQKNNHYSEKLTYLEVLGHIRESKGIVEILQNGQSGLSLRVMESLVFKKKLITNNDEIKNEFFYNSNNIFVLDSDQYESLDHFMKTPYQEVKGIEYYDFVNWVNRFSWEE